MIFKIIFKNESFFMEKMKHFKSTIEAEIAHIEKYLIRSWHKATKISISPQNGIGSGESFISG